MRNRVADWNLSAVDCVFRLRLRPDSSSCHLELVVDRDAVSLVDDIGQRVHSRSAEKVEPREADSDITGRGSENRPVSLALSKPPDNV